MIEEKFKLRRLFRNYSWYFNTITKRNLGDLVSNTENSWGGELISIS